MSAATPGQAHDARAMYEVAADLWTDGVIGTPSVPWDEVIQKERDGWAKIGQAFIAAREPKSAPDARRALLDIGAEIERLDEPGPTADYIRLLVEYGLGEGPRPGDGTEPKPAPELACRVCDGSGMLTVPDNDGESASEQPCPDPVHDGDDWFGVGDADAGTPKPAPECNDECCNPDLPPEPEPKASRELAEAMREARLIRERVTAVATGLEDRARINHPSKVSQICTDIAASLRRALEGK